MGARGWADSSDDISIFRVAYQSGLFLKKDPLLRGKMTMREYFYEAGTG